MRHWPAWTRPANASLAAVGAALALLAGCGSMVERRSLASGRSDVAVYELSGADPMALRREALRLCPDGAQVLRSAQLDTSPALAEGRLRDWMNAAAALLDPPLRMAQLQVLCREPAAAGIMTLPPPAAPKTDARPSQPEPAAVAPAVARDERPAAAAVDRRMSAGAVASPVLPVGPISAEW